MFKRIISLLLSAILILSCVVYADCFDIETKAATTDNIDYGLVDQVQNGQILHCWN